MLFKWGWQLWQLRQPMKKYASKREKPYKWHFSNTNTTNQSKTNESFLLHVLWKQNFEQTSKVYPSRPTESEAPKNWPLTPLTFSKKKPKVYPLRPTESGAPKKWRLTRWPSKVYPLRRRVPFARHVVSAWCRLLSYNIGSAHLLRKSDLWAIDPLTFSKKNPSRAIPRSTYIHPPSLAKIHKRTSGELGNKQTDRQTLLEL